MADTLDDLIAGLQNYVVAPLNAFGLGGLVFDVAAESMATLQADITDHYTEDNKALQDHIAIKPKRITLKGFVGEVVYNAPGATDNTQLQTVTQKLTSISAYLQVLSASATQAQALLSNPVNSTLTVNSIAGALPSAANLYGLVKNTLGAFGDTAKQQNAYSYFSACQSAGILMGIQTPWEFLTNMAIETIVAIQPEDSIFMTDFSITFKQIRIAATQTASTALSGTGGITSPSGITQQGVAAQQGQAATNNGISSGLTLPSPLLPGIQGSIVSVSNIANSGLSNIFTFR
jgi:hypothetical protein